MYLCKTLKNLILILAIASVFASCTKYDTDPDVYFVSFNPVSIKESVNQNAQDHNITDVWVYNNQQFIGVYPLGAKVTMTYNTRPSSLTIFAGIKQNGISDTRVFYPFYEQITLDTFADLGQHIQIPLIFSYKSQCTFTWTETFDALGTTLRKSDVSDAGYSLVNTNAFQGKSLECNLDSSKTVAQIESSAYFTLPINTSDVYLELQYQCTGELQIGLLNTNGLEKEVMRLYPSNTWNKIYIALGNTINAEPKSAVYKIYFRTLRALTGKPVQFRLDNIKLVHYL